MYQHTVISLPQDKSLFNSGESGETCLSNFISLPTKSLLLVRSSKKKMMARDVSASSFPFKYAKVFVQTLKFYSVYRTTTDQL
jgi:hypothetical protein